MRKFFCFLGLLFVVSFLHAQTPGGTTINGIGGPFTFTGGGVSCVGYVCTFSGGSGGDVTSVFGRTGAVVAVSADYSAYYLTLSGGTMAGPLNTETEYSNGTCTTAKTITAANGNRQNVTLTAGDACALTFTQPGSGTISISLKVIQSAAGSFNGTISGCKWPGGTVPTITATTGAIDFVSAYLDGTNAYCVASQNFK